MLDGQCHILHLSKLVIVTHRGMTWFYDFSTWHYVDTTILLILNDNAAIVKENYCFDETSLTTQLARFAIWGGYL